MGRSTPGTRFRTELVRNLRDINGAMRTLTQQWTLWADGKISRSPGELAAAKAVGDHRWWRKRLEHEYPENRAKVLHDTYAELGRLQTMLYAAQQEIAKRYATVLREQEAAEHAAQQRDAAAAHRQIHSPGN